MKTIVCELNPVLIKRVEKQLKTCKVIGSHYSVINDFKNMITKDTMTVNEKGEHCLAILKEVCNSENKGQCRALLEELNKSFTEFESFAKEFEDEVFSYKDYWLPYKFNSVYTAGLHSYTKMATIKEIFENPVGKAPIT